MINMAKIIEVSSTQAKTHLGEYLRAVEAGTVYVITVYGRPVATLSSLSVAAVEAALTKGNDDA
jgi:prevent-host-death family protein